MRKQTLSVIIKPQTRQRLYQEVGKGKISQFVEELIIRGLDNHNDRLEQEQKKFEQKLISGYKRSARSKALQKENELWDEVVGEAIK